MKIKFRRFASSTTIHGLHELIDEPSKWLKLVWTVVMVVSVCVCCWQLFATILEYVKGPTSMKPSVKSYDLLPTINFHLMNVIDISKLEEMGLSLSHYKLILDNFPIMNLSNPLEKDEATLARDQLQEVQENLGLTNFTEFIEYVAYKPDDLFGYSAGIVPEVTLRINEMGPWYEVKINRTNSNIENMDQLSEMKCFTSWVIAYDRARYDDRFDTTEIHRGLFDDLGEIWVSIGDESHDTTKWLAIQQQTNRIYIQSQLTRFIDRSSLPCSMKYETVAECQNLCILESLQNPNSDCEWYHGQSVNISYPCQGILDIKDIPYPEHCLSSEACPRACEEWNHSIDITFARPKNYEEEPNTWVGIMASSTDVAVMEEYYTYSSSSLFSNIGGILSLYLGASVLSIIHVVYYLSCKIHNLEKDSKKVQD